MLFWRCFHACTCFHPFVCTCCFPFLLFFLSSKASSFPLALELAFSLLLFVLRARPPQRTALTEGLHSKQPETHHIYSRTKKNRKREEAYKSEGEEPRKGVLFCVCLDFFFFLFFISSSPSSCSGQLCPSHGFSWILRLTLGRRSTHRFSHRRISKDIAQ